MGRTACTEPQCLYKGALYLFYILIMCLITEVKREGREMEQLTPYIYKHIHSAAFAWEILRKSLLRVRDFEMNIILTP
jgi:hypothetical protein